MASLSSDTVPFGVVLGRKVDEDAMFRLSTCLAVARVVLPAWPADWPSDYPSGEARNRLWMLLNDWSEYGSGAPLDVLGYAHQIIESAKGQSPNLERQIKNACHYRIWWRLFNDASGKLVRGEPSRPMKAIGYSYTFAQPTAYILSHSGTVASMPWDENGLCTDGWIDGSDGNYRGTYNLPLYEIRCAKNQCGRDGASVPPILPTMADEAYQTFWGAVNDRYRGNARDWWRSAAVSIGLSSWLPEESEYRGLLQSGETYREMIDGGAPGSGAPVPVWFGDAEAPQPAYYGHDLPLKQLKPSRTNWNGNMSVWSDEFPYHGLCAVISALDYLERCSVGYLVEMSHHRYEAPGVCEHKDTIEDYVWKVDVPMTYTCQSGTTFEADDRYAEANFGGYSKPPISETYESLNDFMIKHSESRDEFIGADGEHGYSESVSIGYSITRQGYGENERYVATAASDDKSQTFFDALIASEGNIAYAEDKCMPLPEAGKRVTVKASASYTKRYSTRIFSRLAMRDQAYPGDVDAVPLLVKRSLASIPKYVFFATTELTYWGPDGSDPYVTIRNRVRATYKSYGTGDARHDQRMDTRHACIWTYIPQSAGINEYSALTTGCGRVHAELNYRIQQIKGTNEGVQPSLDADRTEKHATGVKVEFSHSQTWAKEPTKIGWVYTGVPFYVKTDAVPNGIRVSTDSILLPDDVERDGDYVGSYSFNVRAGIGSGFSGFEVKYVKDGSPKYGSDVVWYDDLKKSEATTPYKFIASGELKMPAALVKFQEGRIN